MWIKLSEDEAIVTGDNHCDERVFFLIGFTGVYLWGNDYMSFLSEDDGLWTPLNQMYIPNTPDLLEAIRQAQDWIGKNFINTSKAAKRKGKRPIMHPDQELVIYSDGELVKPIEVEYSKYDKRNLDY